MFCPSLKSLLGEPSLWAQENHEFQVDNRHAWRRSTSLNLSLLGAARGAAGGTEAEEAERGVAGRGRAAGGKRSRIPCLAAKTIMAKTIWHENTQNPWKRLRFPNG